MKSKTLQRINYNLYPNFNYDKDYKADYLVVFTTKKNDTLWDLENEVLEYFQADGINIDYYSDCSYINKLINKAKEDIKNDYKDINFEDLYYIEEVIEEVIKQKYKSFYKEDCVYDNKYWSKHSDLVEKYFSKIKLKAGEKFYIIVGGEGACLYRK